MIDSTSSFNCRGRLLIFEQPIVMGIININSDSFYKGSRVTELDKMIDMAGMMFENGASIVDLGSVSSRPGSVLISETEEIDRIIPAVEKLCKAIPTGFFSIDTFRGAVARQAYQTGIHIINDISGTRFDSSMLDVLSELNLPYVLMHNGSAFETMHKKAAHVDPVTEVFDYFAGQIEILHQHGIYDIFLDPGFGFGKTMHANFEILKNLEFYKILNLPILVGISRKSMIYKTLDLTVEESLIGTTALNMYALSQGAKVLRVHDVKEAVQVCKLFDQMNK